MNKLRYFALLFASFLVGCSGIPPQTTGSQSAGLVFESEIFDDAPEIVEAEDIFRLSDEQASAFLRYFHDPANAWVPGHRRVFDYLSLVTSDFTYDGDTLTASESLVRRSGNCLSLAILTTALADLAGIEIAYQLMDSAPVFQSQGEVIYRGVHARSILYDPEWEPGDDLWTIRRPGISVDYFPTGRERFVGNLPGPRFVAMYYSNVAAENIAAGDFSPAFWLLRKSLEYSPDNAAAVNMMAVVYRHAGDQRKAEDVYRFGIEHASDKVSLLRNYRILLADQGRMEEAREIGAKLDRLGESNPFDWIHAAQQAHDEGHYREALTLYEKAVAIAPYLHESYFGMAKSFYELGDLKSARSELVQAMAVATRESTRSLYEAKLVALEKSRPR